jgi:hypothetical protein
MPPSVISPPLFGVSLRSQRSNVSSTSATDTSKALPSTPVKKTKKTVKLFWKEVRDDPIILAKLQQTGMIWDELHPVSIDTQKLEHLFESRAKDLITKVWTDCHHVSLTASFHLHSRVCKKNVKLEPDDNYDKIGAHRNHKCMIPLSM